MRRNANRNAGGEEGGEIDLTPMLDVVFIMLIFYLSFGVDRDLEVMCDDRIG